MGDLRFRAYTASDLTRCLAIFDGNTPEFFAPNERPAYASFLHEANSGYEVCVSGDQVVGAFGLIHAGSGRARLHWILVDRTAQARGIGSAIMARVTGRAHSSGTRIIVIAASHRSAPFFAKHGAEATGATPDGWGPGMHRVDMELHLDPAPHGGAR